VLSTTNQVTGNGEHTRNIAKDFLCAYKKNETIPLRASAKEFTPGKPYNLSWPNHALNQQYSQNAIYNSKLVNSLNTFTRQYNELRVIFKNGTKMLNDESIFTISKFVAYPEQP